MIDLIDAIKIVNKEIIWCLENPDRAFSTEYRKGFTNGLIQAKYIILELEKELLQHNRYTTHCNHSFSNLQLNPDDGSVWCFACDPPRCLTIGAK